MKKFPVLLFAAALFALGRAATPSTGSGQAPAPAAASTAPKSVIHVITVAWKEGTTPEQIKTALDGVQKLPVRFKGITRVWIRTLKVQNPAGAEVKKSHVFVMEFANEAALDAYESSPAQLDWYKVYLPIRETSSTYDITN